MSTKYIPPMFRQVPMATTGMHLAAASGRHEKVLEFCRTHPNWIRFRDANDRTPLAMALYYGKQNVVDAIFDCPAILDATKREMLGALGDRPLAIVEEGLRVRSLHGTDHFDSNRLGLQKNIFHLMVEYLGVKYARTHSGTLFSEMRSVQY